MLSTNSLAAFACRPHQDFTLEEHYFGVKSMKHATKADAAFIPFISCSQGTSCSNQVKRMPNTRTPRLWKIISNALACQNDELISIGERAPDLDGIRSIASELDYDPEHINAELFLVPASDFARNKYKTKIFATLRNIVSPKLV